MKAPRLAPGDAVAVVATAGPVERDRIQRGLRFLAAKGHPVRKGASLMSRHGYLAGTDARRAADLNRAIGRADVPGIFFARGGWGTARLLDVIDLAALRRRPRVLLGYSDLTTLFMALQRRGGGYPYRYGPSAAELGEPHAFDLASLDEALYLPERRIRHAFGAKQVLRAGSGRGLLIGGCLSLLVGLLGTPYDMPWDGCVLFWEEVNEPTYRIDRMLTQLRLAGKLHKLAGMVVGKLAGCEALPGKPDLPMKDVILDAVRGTRYPVVTGFPAGHARPKMTLLCGVPAELSTRRRELVLRARG